MLFLYNLSLFLYSLAVRIYSPFNDKAKKWINGRKDWQRAMSQKLGANEKRIWVHCSSMGEYEQARPVLEAIKSVYPSYKTVVTFFSPSGYEACKNSSLADYVFYLPHDNRRNAERFVALINPSVALFVKYEFWYYYLTQLKKQRVPTLLVSGAFREGQAFFKWYGGIFREMLSCFSFYFLQDEGSERLLHTIGITKNILVSGDTRYDRVAEIAKNIKQIEAVEQFKGGHKLLIGGSTWPGDEKVIRDGLEALPADWKLILVPHEVDKAHIQQLQALFHNEPILFSDLNSENTGWDKRILIINNIGMLSRLFAYADAAFIGGGFQKGGIHNILEPAVFGVPVIFGPVFAKFVEAKTLVSSGYVFPVKDAGEFKAILTRLATDEQFRLDNSATLKTFMQEHTGATGMIMKQIEREKWVN